MSEIEDLPIKLKKKFDDGGPVYPQYAEPMGNDVYKIGPEGGITRRNECADRIAAQLSVEAWSAPVNNEGETIGHIVRISYALADAMIAEGRKGA